MLKNYSDSKVPSFRKSSSYNYSAKVTSDSFRTYQELTKIAEEIEKCRRQNS